MAAGLARMIFFRTIKKIDKIEERVTKIEANVIKILTILQGVEKTDEKQDGIMREHDLKIANLEGSRGAKNKR